MMKWIILSMILAVSLLPGLQSGRVRREEPPEESTTNAESPLKLGSSRPVLVNMTPEDFQSTGLNKLSDEELKRLDRWFLELLVKLQSLPKGESLQFERLGEDSASRQMSDIQRQQLEAQIRDLQSRLTLIHRESTRMTFDLNQARLAAARGDLGLVRNAIFGLESSVQQINQASQ